MHTAFSVMALFKKVTDIFSAVRIFFGILAPSLRGWGMPQRRGEAPEASAFFDHRQVNFFVFHLG